MKKIFNLKTSYILLLIFLIASAVFLYFFSLKVDKRYSKLIVTETQISNNIYKITNIHNKNVNLLFTALYASQADSITKMEREWEINTAMDSAFFNILSGQVFLDSQNKQILPELLAIQKDLDISSRLFFDAKSRDGNDSAHSLLTKKISPFNRAYRDKLEVLLNLNNKCLLDISDKLSAEDERTGLLYLTMGATPFFLFIVYLLLGLGLLSYLAIQIFRTEHS